MRLEIQCEDRVGMAREVLDLFIPYQIDMKRIEVDTKRRCMYCAFPDIAFAQLQTLLAEIRRIEGVEDVKTVLFTPSEREHNALFTLLKALPDGVIAVDLQGHVTMATEIALQDLALSNDALMGQPLTKFIKGVRFNDLHTPGTPLLQSKRVKVHGQNVLLEMLPIFVSDQEGESIPAGAVINLKSEVRLDQQTASLRRAPKAETQLDEYWQKNLANSEAMQQCLQHAQSMIPLDMPLLVCGDVGVGKQELVAAMYQKWLHTQHDMDANIHWMAAAEVTVASIGRLKELSGWLVVVAPERLTEPVQNALTAYLKHQTHTMSASAAPIRIVTISQMPLAELRQLTNFSAELFYLLSALTLKIPALVNRKADIVPLAELFLGEFAERMKKTKPKITKGAAVKLALYSWPGNLNELRNVCLQALVLSQSSSIGVDDVVLDQDAREQDAICLLEGSLDKTMKHWEAKLLRDLYPNFPSSRLLAKEVGLSHSAVANKLREYGIGHMLKVK